MANTPSRRAFLLQNCRTAFGLSSLTLVSCSDRDAVSESPRDGDGLAGLTHELEARIPSLLRAARVPGLSMALIRSGRVVWSRGFGVMHAGSPIPVTTDTLFEAGSMSKPVFAYAVMKLCETNLLDLDTPLTRYIPERWIEDDARLDQITARHVLSHTSGFQNWRSEAEPLSIHFDPGTQHLYSGEGYSYLQLVVAHLTGEVSRESCEVLYDGLRVCETDIDAYLKTNLLRPFGMRFSGYVWDDALADQTAGPHDAGGLPLSRPHATPILAARFGAAGGLTTTPTEYARFLIEVVDPALADPFRLNTASRDAMIQPQVRLDDSSSWALGWQVLHQETGDLLSHGGDNPGFKAFMVASMAQRSGYVIMTNSDNGMEVIGELVNGDSPLNVFITN